MSRALASDFSLAVGAWWRAALALAWVLGVAVQLRQPSLWAGDAYPLLLACGLLGVLAAMRLHVRGRAGIAWRAVALAAVVVLGFSFAGWRAALRLDDALAPEWEGCDIEVTGVVDEMPQVTQEGAHFAFVVESSRALTMTPRAIRRVAALDAAAGRPLVSEVEAALAASGGAMRPPSSDDTVDLSGTPGVDDDDAAGGASPPPPSSASLRVPSRIWLAWSGNPRDDRAVAAAPAPLRAGQRWRLPVRLRLPHGTMNPDGFDAELWLFDQGLRATGAVRGNGTLLAQGWAPIENARQWVRDRLLLSGTDPGRDGDPRAAGALAALAVGDQAAIDGPGWEVFRNTGVAHLMSISGLHITMLGWLGGRAIGAVWRRSERAALWVPTPTAARWGGVGVAWLYALLAGWGVPAQRTVVMLAGTALLRGAGVNWPAVLVALAAMLPVTWLDPWALLQPGFWLSFAAVGLLMVSEPVRASPEVGSSSTATTAATATAAVATATAAAATAATATDVPPVSCALRTLRSVRSQAIALASWSARHLSATKLVAGLRSTARVQFIASIGLAPLTLVAFQQVALVGLLSNLVAEPWVTLVVTPLALLGIVLPPLWLLAAWALRPLLWWLGVLSRLPLASVHVPTAPAWGLLAGLAGGALLMLPLPWRVRLLGLPLLLPLVAPFVARPPSGRFELVAADVGQGSAVLLRTHSHLLLFDTGPRFGADNDAGKRLLLPLLQSRGEPRIDTLVLSHADADHVGGAQSLIDRLPVLALRSSLDARNPLRANALPHVACEAGQGWRWEGVEFRLLHPLASDYRPGAKTNSISCVLRVEDAEGRSALLTGDIEAPQEAALIARDAAALRSDVLLVPHHGSHTSSTEAFLRAVRPRVAVVQVGYRSRYGHPAPEVVARYRAQGIFVVRTDHCGAWLWTGDQSVCTRAVRRRYWSWQATPPAAERAGNPLISTVAYAGSVVANHSSGSPRGAAPHLAGGSLSSP